MRQLHAQKSARNEEVPRRRRTRKTTEPERSAAAVSVAEPLGDELFTMTVTRAVRVLESRARSQTLQEKKFHRSCTVRCPRCWYTRRVC